VPKKKVKGITFLDGLLRWKQSQVYVLEGKLRIKIMQKVPMVEHLGEKTREFGGNFLLAQNERKH
jgi:hypothetical protein